MKGRETSEQSFLFFFSVLKETIQRDNNAFFSFLFQIKRVLIIIYNQKNNSSNEFYYPYIWFWRKFNWQRKLMEYVIQKTCKEFPMCSDILSAEMTMKQLSLLIRCIFYVIKHSTEVKHPKEKKKALKKQLLTKKLW